MNDLDGSQRPSDGLRRTLPARYVLRCCSCGERATTTIVLEGFVTPVCLRHFNVWKTPEFEEVENPESIGSILRRMNLWPRTSEFARGGVVGPPRSDAEGVPGFLNDQHHPGGFVSGTPMRVELADEECILHPKTGKCMRKDRKHFYEVVQELHGDDGVVGKIEECRHPACCVEKVVTALDGKHVANLCTNCDEKWDV